MFESKTESSNEEKSKFLWSLKIGSEFMMETCSDTRLNSVSGDVGTQTPPAKGMVKCFRCSYTTNEVSEMRKHAMSHESKPDPGIGEKLYKCSECKYSTNRGDHIKRHTAIHQGIKPHLCPYCEYRAGRKEHLRRHLGTHSWERPRSSQSSTRTPGQIPLLFPVLEAPLPLNSQISACSPSALETDTHSS